MCSGIVKVGTGKIQVQPISSNIMHNFLQYCIIMMYFNKTVKYIL